MKVKVEKRQYGIMFLSQLKKPAPPDIEANKSEIPIASVETTTSNMPFATISITFMPGNCICVSSSHQRDLPSSVGIGIMLLTDEREAHIAST